MKTGDYLWQEHTETTALVIGQLKGGGWKVLKHDWRGRVIKSTTTGWYPSPVIITRESIDPKVLAKIDKAMLLQRNI